MKGRWVIAAAAVWFGVLVGRFYHPVYGWTRLLQFDQQDAAARVPALQGTPIFVEPHGGGYDGMYYAQIATAPSLRDRALRRAVDNLPYRARRILPSAVAWVLGAGHAGTVIQIYAVLNLVVWVVLAWTLGRWLPWNEWRGVVATLGILFSAGALSSVRFALTDLPAMALLAYAIAAQARRGSAVAFAAACLSKETSILALPGLWPFRRHIDSGRSAIGPQPAPSAVTVPQVAPSAPTDCGPGSACSAAPRSSADEASRDPFSSPTSAEPSGSPSATKSPPRNARDTATAEATTRQSPTQQRGSAPPPRGRSVAVALLPLAVWVAYVRFAVGPGDAGIDNFAPPVVGLVHKVQHIIHGVGHVDDVWILATTFALVGLLFQAGYLLLRCRWEDAWWRVGIVQVGLMLLLGRAVWEGFPGAAFRAVLPLTLAFNFYAVRRRAAWPAFLAGNLGVVAGVLTLWTVPTDSLEVGAGRSGRRAAVVVEGPGWYGSEHSWRHTWAWAGPSGHDLTFKTWGIPADSSVTVHCHLDARALSPRRLTIREGDRIAWEGAIGPAKSPLDFDVTLGHGAATLVCATDQPPIPEAPDPGARALAFGIYDLKVAFTDARSASR